MDLLKPFKTVAEKVRNYMGEQEKLYQEQEKLDKWKRRLSDSLSEHDTFRANCGVWDALYNSTKAIGPNITKTPISNRDREIKPDNARQVVNLTYQLIESQIDISVPKPNVQPCEYDQDNELEEKERNNMIEGMLVYMSDGETLKKITSENERIAKKNGLCIYKVCYNPNYKSHKYIGIIETTNPHPANVIPQKGVFRVKDMDYLFHIENRTVDYICRTYGEELRNQIENENAEYPNIDDLSSTSSTIQDKNNKLSVVECWYKDKDGDVCLLTWVNDIIIRDIPKFFYKRDEENNIIEFEEIELPPIDDGMGNLIPQPSAKVPVHAPKQFPFIIQYNVPKEKSYYGKSDPEIIYDQQEAIKKVLSSHDL